MLTISSGNNIGSTPISTVSSSTEIGETWIINESAIMYMRPKTISFVAEGLKPNTVYYPFFNGIDVSSYCSMVNNTVSSTLKTDSIGTVVGNFYLPASSFTCGSHTFKLVDAVKITDGSNNSKINIPDPQYGAAESIYEASGLLKQQQKQITTLSVVNNVPQDAKVPVPSTTQPIEKLPLPSIVYPTPLPPEPIRPVFPPFVVSNPPLNIPDDITLGNGCFKFYYHYNISRYETQPNYIIPSQSSAIPTNEELLNAISNSIVQSIEPPKISYIKSEKKSDTQWNHVYSITIKTQKLYKKTFLSDVREPNKRYLDSFATKPTGLSDSDVYTPVIYPGSTTPWIYDGIITSGLCSRFQIKIDPLAQSFFIDPTQYPSGIYTTSIAVYFKKVDQSCPVTLELRDMNNGFPGPNVLPGGTVIIPGYAVSQSDNASVATVFTFDQPIYLAPKNEYCFVVKSTSLNYDLWCSRFGDIDIVSGKVIDEQPTNGALFKSSNDSTWTPTQYEDIKYDLNIAEFDNTLTSIISLKPQTVTIGNNTLFYNTKQTLPISYIKTSNINSIVDMYIPMHGMISGDSIFIGDFPVTTINGISSTSFLNKKFTNVSVIDEDNIRFDCLSTANATGNISIEDIPTIINNIPPSPINRNTKEKSIPFSNKDNSLAVLPKIPVEKIAPIPPQSINNSTFEVYTNIVMNELLIDYIGTELPNTSITEKFYSTNTKYSDMKFTEIDNNNTFYEFSTDKLIASPNNENNMADATNNGLLTLELKSNDKYISPSIDLNGLSLMVKSYKIDNQANEIDIIFHDNFDSESLKLALNDSSLNSEIIAGKGNANAKYKSKIINLNSAFTNKRISIFVVGNAPKFEKYSAVIDMYIRVSNDDSTHMDRNWSWVPLDNPKSTDMDYTTKFTPSINSSVMTEWCYEYISEETFSVMDIKLVMRSSSIDYDKDPINTSIIPKIYGIRIITNEN